LRRISLICVNANTAKPAENSHAVQIGAPRGDREELAGIDVSERLMPYSSSTPPMRRFGLSALLALSLFGCVQAPAEGACNTTTADKLLLTMRGGGIEPARNLQGAAAVSFRDWVEARGVPVPMEIDQALIFINDGTGMVAWFNHGCLLDQAQGPASTLDEYFGLST
jgi:hypothetical protein